MDLGQRHHEFVVLLDDIQEKEDDDVLLDDIGNDNGQNQDINDNQVEESNDNIVKNENNSNHDNLDNNNDDNADVSVENADSLSVNNNNDNAEDAGPSAGLEVGSNQSAEEDDPLTGGSRKRFRDEDDQDIFRRWDEFADSSSDSHTDSTHSQDFNRETGRSPVKDTEDAEEDPVPGPSRKRLRKSNRAEDERSSKKARQCDEFADSNSDIVTVTTGQGLADSSGNVDATKDAGAAEQTDNEQDKQVDEEEDLQPRRP
ncbi:hypothetical protein ABVT39_019644 [Epinephelus coioides]